MYKHECHVVILCTYSAMCEHYFEGIKTRITCMAGFTLDLHIVGARRLSNIKV